MSSVNIENSALDAGLVVDPFTTPLAGSLSAGADADPAVGTAPQHLDPVMFGGNTAVAVEGGTTTTLQWDTDRTIQSIEIIEGPARGHVTVNPDNSFALVLSGSSYSGALTFNFRVTFDDGSTATQTASLDVTAPTEMSGWGHGQHYMLETDSNGDLIVETGENHRKVFISGSDDALSRADIATLEGLSEIAITHEWLMDHPEYGGSEGMALDVDAGMTLWNGLTNTRLMDPASHWLMFEKGYTYENTGNLIGRGFAGEDALHPLYVSSWGSGERPTLTDSVVLTPYDDGRTNAHVVFEDLAFEGGLFTHGADNVIVSDCKFTKENLYLQFGSGVTLRDSEVAYVVNPKPEGEFWTGRKAGLLANELDGFLMEGNIFHHNGWEDGYHLDGSTEGGMPPNIFSHNVYIQNTVTDLTFRDNILSQGASFGAHIRSGGYVEDNVFVDNNIAVDILGGIYEGAGPIGNFTLFTDNLVTSGAHKNTDAFIGAKTAGIVNLANGTTFIDNIIAHLADPDNPAELLERLRADPAFNSPNETRFDDTIIYNWVGSDPVSGIGIKNNTPGLDEALAMQTTIQRFAAEVMGRTGVTIADLMEYIISLGDTAGDDSLTADDIIAYFQKGFGVAPNGDGSGTEHRFIPNSLADGIRWDNRLNWSDEDVPDNGDSVDLGGNWVQYGATTTLDAFDLGDGGRLDVNYGKLTIDGTLNVGDGGGTIRTHNAGQIWIGGYSDLDVLKVDAAGGRFANTGIALGNIQMDVSDNAQVILATDGAEYIMRARSSLTVTGGDAKVGFDGVAGGTAALLLTEGADLKFVAEGGKIGTIEEFYSGKYEQSGSGVRSGVNLGGATLEVDVSDVAALGQGSFELIHVDELIGTFGTINIIGLASNQAAKVVINYTTDKVMLHLGALGSGKGVPTLQTVGEPSDAKADAGLYAVLTDGHGVYPVDRPGSGDSDTLDGSKNNDTLKGAMGNSEIRGFAGNDTIYGRAGNDTIYGGAGQDKLHGNRGADMLFGNGGNDILLGGPGRDQLFGGMGDDMLWGGIGNDRLTGGAGQDGFGFGENFGRDRIIDFQIGIDKIHLDYVGASFEDLLIRGRGGDTVINSSQGVIVLEGIAFGDLSVSDFVF